MLLRPASVDDAKLLYEWRSDPTTRAMSRDTSELVWEHHLAWVTERLSRANHGLYIAEIDGVPVGTVRIDHDEISYTVAPAHRKKGIGEMMLRTAKDQFGPLIAKVKKNNMASEKIAERSGHIIRYID
ncbi:GNAT family N-acetyltransferase [Nitratireductor pacificus]|uniref:N-acetyltransferase domain-containing protein n=1 Tax=Nitratireductor pacificus pht-3B TaxID=391937 RepID=K2N1W8_9HYPH|nr:GNAT family N-acetyltransferase [Nitratireductor pacificus]EKF18193.1 hypothetical protein NA2_14812 [Nitratireductor pacificus pht-3B]